MRKKTIIKIARLIVWSGFSFIRNIIKDELFNSIQELRVFGLSKMRLKMEERKVTTEATDSISLYQWFVSVSRLRVQEFDSLHMTDLKQILSYSILQLRCCHKRKQQRNFWFFERSHVACLGRESVWTSGRWSCKAEFRSRHVTCSSIRERHHSGDLRAAGRHSGPSC